MNALIKMIRSDKILYYSFAASLCFIVLNILLIAAFYTKLPPIIPIFNQMPWGEARLGGTSALFLPVALAMVICILNMIGTFYLYNRIPILSRIVAITTILLSLLAFLISIRTINLIL